MKNIKKRGILIGMLVIGLLAVFFISIQAKAELSATSSNVYVWDDQTKTAAIKGDLSLPVADIKLLSNTESCLVDCESIIRIIPYANFDNLSMTVLNYRDKFGRDAGINVKGMRVQYLLNESYIENTPVWGDCIPIIDTKNQSISCVSEIIKYNSVIKYETKWVDTDFTNVKLVIGQPIDIKISGKKKPTENIDWVPTILGVTIPEMAWWNSTWTKKKAVLIQENSNTNLTNMSVRLNVSWVSGMKTDFTDIRFLDGTETLELGYWNETQINGNSAIIWVKAPYLNASINTTIYMYYGNAGANSNQNFSTAFLFGDDFLGTTLAPYWLGFDTSGSSSAVVGGGYLNLSQTGGNNLNRMNRYVNLSYFNFTNVSNIVFEANATIKAFGGASWWAVSDGLFPGGSADFDGSNNSYYTVNGGGSTGWFPHKTIGNTATQGTVMGLPPQGDQGFFSIVMNKLGMTRVETYISNSTFINSTNWTTNFVNISLSPILGGKNGFLSQTDWVRVRTYASITPSVVFGVVTNFQPNVTLYAPANNSQYNVSLVTFNCTASTDSPTNITNVTLFLNGIQNLTVINNTANFTQLFTSYNLTTDGAYNYTCISYDSNGFQGNTSIFNFSVITYPNITIIQPVVSEVTRSLTINISTMNQSALSYCFFNITRGASLEVANTAIANCRNTTVSVSSDATYVINVWVNTTFNFIDMKNKTFTVTTNTPPAASGGGGGGGINFIPVISLEAINGTRYYTDIERATIYAAINNFCSEKIRKEPLAVADYSEQCSLSETEIKTVQSNIIGLGVTVEIADLTTFYAEYKESKLIQAYATQDQIETYKLYTSTLGLIVLLQFNPPSIDSPVFLNLKAGETYTIPYTITSNKPLASCQTVSATPDLTCTVQNNTLMLTYTVKDSNFLSSIFSGVISASTDATSDKLEQKRISVVFRIYNLGYTIGGVPVYLILIFGGFVLLSVSFIIFHRFRKKRNQSLTKSLGKVFEVSK